VRTVRQFAGWPFEQYDRGPANSEDRRLRVAFHGSAGAEAVCRLEDWRSERLREERLVEHEELESSHPVEGIVDRLRLEEVVAEPTWRLKLAIKSFKAKIKNQSACLHEHNILDPAGMVMERHVGIVIEAGIVADTEVAVGMEKSGTTFVLPVGDCMAAIADRTVVAEDSVEVVEGFEGTENAEDRLEMSLEDIAKFQEGMKDCIVPGWGMAIGYRDNWELPDRFGKADGRAL